MGGERKRIEFGGPAGNILLMIGLPVTVYYLYYCVRFNGGWIIPGNVVNYAPFTSFWESIIPTGRAAAIFFSWFALQVILELVLPGKVVPGAVLADGSRLNYRMNGLAAFVVTFSLLTALVAAGLVDVAVMYDNFGALISVVTMFVIAFSVFLYVYPRKSGQAGAISGSRIHDFFMGTVLNPRIPPVTGFDLKFFCESRPGLMGWLAVSLSFMGVQYQRHGTVTAAMVIVVAGQLLYIADYFWNEPAILTTTDIVNDRFGFMLAFGDLAWVPLTYALQAFYLIEHAHVLPWWGVAGIAVLNIAGYYLFRAVNLQKHRFRTDPAARIWGKEPRFIQTAHGNRLLVSGFWGWSRHFNYVGDITMALAWCLPCLFASPLPYFYVIYFTILLIHRERRDDRRCAAKYGADWDDYRKRVRWRILPGVY